MSGKPRTLGIRISIEYEERVPGLCGVTCDCCGSLVEEGEIVVVAIRKEDNSTKVRLYCLECGREVVNGLLKRVQDEGLRNVDIPEGWGLLEAYE